MFRWTLLATLSVLLAVPAAGGAGGVQLRLLATGDSLIQPLDGLLGPRVEREGGKPVRDPRPGTGLTKRLVLDWVRHARKQAEKYRPTATVVFIGANDSERLKSRDGPEVACCRRAWIDAYADRVAKMISAYQRGTRGHVYWLTLPTPRDQGRRAQFQAINLAIEQAVTTFAERAHMVDTIPAISPGNEFRRKARYRGETVVIRHRDGIHLTGPGAKIVRDLVLRAMRADGLV